MNLKNKERIEGKMTNILFTIILALGFKVVDMTFASKYYLITYQDGQKEEVVITKNKDVCPYYCGVDHPHRVNICEGGDCEYIDKSFIISRKKAENNTFNLYCNGKQIMLFEEIYKKKNKKVKSQSIEIF